MGAFSVGAAIETTDSFGPAEVAGGQIDAEAIGTVVVAIAGPAVGGCRQIAKFALKAVEVALGVGVAVGVLQTAHAEVVADVANVAAEAVALLGAFTSADETVGVTHTGHEQDGAVGVDQAVLAQSNFARFGVADARVTGDVFRTSGGAAVLEADFVVATFI